MGSLLGSVSLDRLTKGGTVETPTWKGVVMIIRQDQTQAQRMPPTAQVLSARLVQYGGRRAIVTKVPLSLVAHYFKAEDGDAVEVYAELTGDHLEFYERASKAEFFTTAETGSLVVPATTNN